MEFHNPYWENRTKIELLQKWIIVHSILYYEYDISIVDDYMYDMNSKQLDRLMAKDPAAAKRSKWYHVFQDEWAGFQLAKRLTLDERAKIFTVCEQLKAKF